MGFFHSNSIKVVIVGYYLLASVSTLSFAQSAGAAQQPNFPDANETEAEANNRLLKTYSGSSPAVARYLAEGILGKWPDDVAAHYILGNCLVAEKQSEDAYKQYLYCYQHDQTSQVGIYARQALARLSESARQNGNANGNAPVKQADPKMEEFKRTVGGEMATALKTKDDNLRNTLADLSRQRDAEIASIPQFIVDVDGNQYDNPAFAPAANRIHKRYHKRKEQARADYHNQVQVVSDFYNKKIASYDETGANLNSQGVWQSK